MKFPRKTIFNHSAVLFVIVYKRNSL